MLSISIVLFNNQIKQINELFNCLTQISNFKTLYVIDNSPKSLFSNFVTHNLNVEYYHFPENLGFGAGHNIALKLSIERNTTYHLILNPDISFKIDVVTPMITYMLSNDRIGMMMPKILNADGSIQYLPKLLPSPLSILLRKLKSPPFIYKKFINKYELRFVESEKIYNSPILSGCFTILNIGVIKKVGIYDNRFFMYFEDFDLSRRVHENYLTLYFPQVSVIHGYQSDANKSFKIFLIFIKSAIKYFNKWGWIFDKKRLKFNSSVLNKLKK